MFILVYVWIIHVPCSQYFPPMDIVHWKFFVMLLKNQWLTEKLEWLKVYRLEDRRVDRCVKIQPIKKTYETRQCSKRTVETTKQVSVYNVGGTAYTKIKKKMLPHMLSQMNSVSNISYNGSYYKMNSDLKYMIIIYLRECWYTYHQSAVYFS